MDSDGEDDPFHGLLNTRTIRADPDVELVDEYVKYITKDRDENVQNPLQWWRDHLSIYSNLAQMVFDFIEIQQCYQNVSEVSERLATPSQLVEVTYQMILWKVGRHCAHGYQLV